MPVIGGGSKVPSKPDWCYLSSGTWSLLGVEVPKPVINAETFKYNFTNEGGVAGTTRLLKNIMGLWLVQECRRHWSRGGKDYSYDELIGWSAAALPFASLINPNNPSFFAPGDMPRQSLRSVREPVRTCPATKVRLSVGDGEPGTEIPLDDRAA